jgi:hypothetical protein
MTAPTTRTVFCPAWVHVWLLIRAAFCCETSILACLRLALLGHGAMSELSPVSGVERKSHFRKNEGWHFATRKCELVHKDDKRTELLLRRRTPS